MSHDHELGTKAAPPFSCERIEDKPIRKWCPHPELRHSNCCPCHNHALLAVSCTPKALRGRCQSKLAETVCLSCGDECIHVCVSVLGGNSAAEACHASHCTVLLLSLDLDVSLAFTAGVCRSETGGQACKALSNRMRFAFLAAIFPPRLAKELLSTEALGSARGGDRIPHHYGKEMRPWESRSRLYED